MSPLGEALDAAGAIDLAKRTLQAICRDENSPAAARAQAARTLAEMSGGLGAGTSSERKSAVEMSEGEIDARLAALAGADTGEPA